MNEINTAIYGVLAGDSTLTGLLATTTSIYHQKAPDGSPLPYVVFNKQSDTEPNDSNHRIIDFIYQVRAYTKASGKAAGTMDARIQVLLHRASLSISNNTLLKINRIGGIEDAFSEPNTDTVYSAGSLFRIRVEKTS
jgi:hypothetical protein